MRINEAELEEAAMDLLRDLGYEILYGPDIAPDGDRPERTTYEEPILIERLRYNLSAINPKLPDTAIGDAVKQLLRADSPNLLIRNRTFHRMLTDGIPVDYREDGRNKTTLVKIIDFDNPDKNEFLAINQYTVIEGAGSSRYNHRPDIVLFINGIPVVVIELKNPGDKNTSVKKAFNQLQTYKKHIPSLFRTNELLVISDGYEAKSGSLSANWERFMPWRTIEGDVEADASLLQMEVLFRGVLDQERLLDYIRYFVTFEDDERGNLIKKSAAWHQFYAVNRGIAETLRATGENGDRKIGVVWHTQGSGKSLTMLFYSAKLIQMLDNPTILVLTDRNDLDNQLYTTFATNRDLLRQDPKQAETRTDIKELLTTTGGGVIFSTIQKFLPDDEEHYPVLSERRNIVVIADEAHRSQYSFQRSVTLKYDEDDNLQQVMMKEGFAAHIRRALPNASYIGFTGTPIELVDRNTVHVFGDYISIYDISQAIEDKTTVPIYYEARLAKIKLSEEIEGQIDSEFEEITEDEEQYAKEKLKRKWSRIAELVADLDRLRQVAEDIVFHFENRLEAFNGKGMIVCMTREICVLLYNELIKIRSEWHSDNDDEGFLKVVMSGSAADKDFMQPHIRQKRQRKVIERRFKDPDDDLRLVIVRDMWLTGFDVPSLHTMYVDKPMKGHNLMQAIARVNRVWKDKPGGLVVDYIGIGYFLKEALSKYSKPSQEKTGIDQEQAVELMKTYIEIIQDMFFGFDYTPFIEGTALQRLQTLAAAMEHILNLKGETPESGKKRFLDNVASLEKAFSLAIPHPDALEARDEIAFFQAVRAGFKKATASINRQRREEIDYAIRQLISRAVITEDVIDIFDIAGIRKPELSILSPEFLEEVRGIKHKSLAVEMMNRLLKDQLKAMSRKNLIQSRSFEELLKQSIIKYTNRTIESAAILEELINLARDMQSAMNRGEDLGLNDDEVAFYDALASNESAVRELADETLKQIAKELVDTVRKSATIDFTVKKSVQARMRLEIRKLLRKYKYPPDKREDAVKLIMEQAQYFGEEWARV